MASVIDTQEAVSAPEDLRLEFTRVIKALRARVFDAWTRPEMIRLWFGPEGMKATGRYTKVNAHDLLQFTWVGSWVPGEQSLVTIHLRDVDDGTEIRLVHDRFNTKESRDGHNKGWIGILDSLAATLAT